MDVLLSTQYSRSSCVCVLMMPLMPLLLLRILFSYFSSSSFPIFLEIVSDDDGYGAHSCQLPV